MNTKSKENYYAKHFLERDRKRLRLLENDIYLSQVVDLLLKLNETESTQNAKVRVQIDDALLRIFSDYLLMERK